MLQKADAAIYIGARVGRINRVHRALAADRALARVRSAIEAAIEFGSPQRQIDGKLLERVAELDVRAVARQTRAALRQRAQFIGNAFDHRP